jgi:dihydrofolate synthase / folylpolyglutamate synthase
VTEGLRTVKWPGRLEIMQFRPLTVLDCAKDAEGARALKESLLKDFSWKKLIVVISISSDKNIAGMIDQLSQAASHFIITSHSVMARAAPPTRIAAEIEKHDKPYLIISNVKSAVEKALSLAGESDMVCITGSVFLAGEARRLWTEKADLKPLL